MDILNAFTNATILVPASSWLIAQILKLIINTVINRRLSVSRLVGDGGMPSGHSATVCSLATMCGFQAGFGSVAFAIAAILAIIVMHDATGVRRETGKHAESLKNIAKVLEEFFDEKDEVQRIEKLKVLVGHTPLQVLCGSLLGILIATTYCLIFL